MWLVSSLVGYFVTWGIPSLLSLFLSMVLYIVAGKLGWVRGVGRAGIRDSAKGLDGPYAGHVLRPRLGGSSSDPGCIE